MPTLPVTRTRANPRKTREIRIISGRRLWQQQTPQLSLYKAVTAFFSAGTRWPWEQESAGSIPAIPTRRARLARRTLGWLTSRDRARVPDRNGWGRTGSADGAASDNGSDRGP